MNKESYAINNFIVFQELTIHSILLDIQHTPRIISKLVKENYHIPNEKAIYSYIHYQLSLLPFREKMELIKLLQQIILRTIVYHVGENEKDQFLPNYLFYDLINTELSVALSQQEDFRACIRDFNYGFVLITENKIFNKENPTIEDLKNWTSWYYYGVKKFVYSLLNCEKTKELEMFFELSFLKYYLSKSTAVSFFTNRYEEELKKIKETKNNSILQFLNLL